MANVYNFDMDRSKALVEIRKVLSKKTKHSIEEKTRFRDLGIDSLEMLDLVVKFEKQFKVQIPDEKLIEINIVSDLLDVVIR